MKNLPARTILVGALLNATALQGQVSATPGDSLPTCAENLSALEAKVKANYAGFLLELKGERLRRYGTNLTRLKASADSTRGDACYFVLRDYISWFDDPHLFLFQSSRIDSSESARRARATARLDVSESDARSYFRQAGERLDPIEGIWYDRALRVAIVPEPGAGAGRFVAIILAPDTTGWSVGAVRARITRGSDGAYDMLLSAPNYSAQHRTARIYRNVLLRMSPGTWGKAFPLAGADSGTLDAFDPRRPALRVRGGTVVVALPSHDPAYRPVIDSLVTAHDRDLRAAQHLIVDLRGNEGGGSQTTRALEPYLASARRRPSPYDSINGTMMMLSSTDQLRYASRSFGPDTSRFVRSLLARMRARPGELVPLADSSEPPQPEPPVEVRGTARVGVLVDRGTVSASEVLVLTAIRSERATVIGEPTAGALDYMSTAIVPFAAREWRWRLGYPTITAHGELPRGGMRGIGISPDVYVEWRRIADPIAEVRRLLGESTPRR